MGSSATGIDVAESLQVLSPKGRPVPLPGWAEWLVRLGTMLARAQHENPWRICVTVPDRSYAALLLTAGFVWATPHGGNEPMEERIDRLKPGDCVSWLDANDELRAGEILEVRAEELKLRRRDHGGFEGSRTKLRSHCGTMYRLRDTEEPFVGGRSLSERLDFLASIARERSPIALLCPSDSALIIGVLTDLNEELQADVFASGGARGRLLDLVRPHGALPGGERSHVALVSSATEPEKAADLSSPGLVVFDGPQGYDRLRDSVSAHASVVILDRWAPRSEFTATSVLTDRNMQFVEGESVPVPPAPAAIEVFSWVGDA